jgi:hypothetical protein
MAGAGESAVVAVRLFEQQCGLGAKLGWRGREDGCETEKPHDL